MVDVTALPQIEASPLTVGAPSRRTVVTLAAWALPAVALTTATPAFAGSTRTGTALSTPDMQVPASGGVTVTATVRDSNGAALAGKAVSFTGPSGATFSPASATTDSSGIATTTLDLKNQWATPGSTATVNATVDGKTDSQGFTVLGANALVFGAGFSSVPTQTDLVFPSPIRQITDSGGGTSFPSFFVALLHDGTVWTKGDNGNGQLGDGTTTNRSTWARVPGLTNATQIAVGKARACALLADGRVMQWGRTPSPSLSPSAVPGISTGSQIAVSSGDGTDGCTFARLANGSVLVWGENEKGGTGTGSVNPGATPTRVDGLGSDVASIDANVNSAGTIMTDGSVRMWGANGWGQLGLGDTQDRSTPTTVPGLSTRAAQLGLAWFNSFVRLEDGSVLGCGYNDGDGELGNGQTSPTNNPSFVPLTGLSSNVDQVATVHGSGYVLMSDGSVRSWGYNNYGQLGDGTTTSRLSPTTLTTIPGGRTIADLGVSVQGSLTMYLVTSP
ncbi:Ig-like domain-containing protein [Microbacterium testaceum]|uniref:Ig-like domain-containing protein n=1 Tax=Microbacterium testaceum TaxID=2033 RepID=UPI0037FDD3C7